MKSFVEFLLENVKNESFFRAEISEKYEEEKLFIPSGYYEAIDKHGDPIFHYDTYWRSDIPETCASKEIIGCVLGASSMSKFGKKLKSGDKIQIYKIDDKPDVDISHWGGADFEHISEVRYRHNVTGKHILEITLSTESVKLINDFYDYKAWEEEMKNDYESECPKNLDYLFKLIDNGKFNNKVHKSILKNNPELNDNIGI